MKRKKEISEGFTFVTLPGIHVSTAKIFFRCRTSELIVSPSIASVRHNQIQTLWLSLLIAILKLEASDS